MFDLNKAIAAWRRALTYNRAFLGDDLDELERHLRDQVEALQTEGFSAREAFGQARREMGDFGTAEAEYRKVYWGKLHRRRALYDELLWRLSMLKNYLKVALRTLRKQKLYTMLNIVGLAIGLACFMLIMRYVQYELSFDRFHEKADRIHRMVVRVPSWVYLGNDHFSLTPAPLAKTLVNEYPEVAHATTLKTLNALLGYGDEHFYEPGLEADAYLFEVFTFPMRIGHPETALAEPNTIVLTQSLAEKIFGDENPMGKTLTFQNQEAYTVTGVIEDVPDNAHFTFSFVRSLVSSSDYLGALDYWSRISWYTYFVLQEEAAYAPLQAKMEALAETYYPDENPEKRWQYIIQPLTSIHLRSHTNFELSTNGNTTSIYLFFGIALAILLLACVNYMNLAVARFPHRILVAKNLFRCA